MKTILYTIYIIMLGTPILYEVADDLHGETPRQNIKDVWFRIGMFIMCALFSLVFLGKSVLASALMPVSVFVMFFDYLVAFVLIKRGVIVGHWFSYLSGVKIFDKSFGMIPPVGRFALRVVFLGISIYLFVI